MTQHVCCGIQCVFNLNRSIIWPEENSVTKESPVLCAVLCLSVFIQGPRTVPWRATPRQNCAIFYSCAPSARSENPVTKDSTVTCKNDMRHVPQAPGRMTEQEGSGDPETTGAVSRGGRQEGTLGAPSLLRLRLHHSLCLHSDELQDAKGRGPRDRKGSAPDISLAQSS